VPPWALVGLVFASGPPVLLDPRAALESGKDEIPLRKAEIELLAGDPARAEETLGAFSPSDDGERTRKLRLEIDAEMAAGDTKLAEPKIEALADRPGWKAHARRQRLRLPILTLRDDAATFGALLFAFALAVLGLGAARELLRLRVETRIFGVTVVVAVLVASKLPAPFSSAISILALSMLALVHAATGAVVRGRPSPKGRLFLLTTLFLGALGALLGVLSRVDPSVFGALLG
jgi:hypothetical protein